MTGFEPALFASTARCFAAKLHPPRRCVGMYVGPGQQDPAQASRRPRPAILSRAARSEPTGNPMLD